MNKSIIKNRDIWAVLKPRLKLFLGIIIGICIGFVLHWSLSPAVSTRTEQSPGTSQESSSEQATIWTCSMHTQIRMPKPGLCPICGMKLIPLSKEIEGEMSGMRQFRTSEAAKALMNIETVPVERRFVTAEIRMVGKVEYDETRVEYITAWVTGRLDRLYVDYTGVPVKKGDHMVYIYSPELFSAQEELIQAIKTAENIKNSQSNIIRDVTSGTVEASREKLRLLGLASEQISEIEKRGTASDHLTIYSPASGIVVHKNAQEGMYVNTGTRIYTVADLSHVWVKLDAYESDLSWLRYGQEVEFTTVSFPGEVFEGTISFIDPVLNPTTRTVKVRVDVPNPAGKLKPEMFVKAVVKANVAMGGKVMDTRLAGKWICPMHPSIIKDEPGECDICEMPLVRTESLGYVSAESDENQKPLVIPVSAALVTGTRAIVYVEVPETDKPTYEGREIVLGPRAGDFYIVRNGLKEGEHVVTKGNFKIDSALQIKAKPSMMTPEGGGGSSGHQHGGAGQMSKSSMDMNDQSSLPVISRSQLNSVIAASEAIVNTVKESDLPQIKLAFEELEKSIEEVDMGLLEGHTHMLWMEISMRLKNDAVEGKDVKTINDAQRVVESLKTNIASLKSKLGLGLHQMNQKLSKKVVNREFLIQLGKLFNEYFDIQKALASDKFEEAMTASGKMQNALSEVDMQLLSEQNHKLWMSNAEELKTILSDAAKREDIETIRKDFALLSEQVFVLTQQLGIPPETTLYQMKCPMAFNNRGATWLQKEQEIFNPYFGSAMLKCGSVIEVIEPGQ